MRAEFVGLTARDRFALEVSLDGKKWTRVWEDAGPGPASAKVAIDEALQPRQAPAKSHYLLAVLLSSGDATHGANLKSLEIETDVMAAPLSLPRLRRGAHRVVYSVGLHFCQHALVILALSGRLREISRGVPVG